MKKIEIDKEELIECINEGLTNQQIADVFSCSIDPIIRRKKEWNLDIAKNRKIEIPKEIFESIWMKANLSCSEVRDNLINDHNIKVSTDTLARIALDYNLPGRKELKKLMYQGGFNTEEEFVEKIKELRFNGFTTKDIANELNITKTILEKRIVDNKIPLNKYEPTSKLVNGKPTKQYLQDRFYICEDTKRLRLKINFINGTKAGSLAGVEQDGHVAIKLGGITYSAYQLVILMIDGYMPSDKGFRVFSKSGLLDMSYNNLIVKDEVRSDEHNKRKKEQTPKDVNKKLMKAIWDNCPEGWHVDHIHPLSKGGLNEPDNLQYLTKEDNLSKSNRLDYKYKTKPIRWQDVINKEDYE